MYAQILQTLAPYGARLVAVSKNHSVEAILELYRQGQRDFGENRVQELLPKYEALPKDIRWHFVGHLQSNKVKYVAPFVHLIHAVDSFDLLKEIQKQALKHQRIIPCLLQFHVAQESSKYGFDPKEIYNWDAHTFESYSRVQISGVMGMATFTDDQEQVRREFQQLRWVFEVLKAQVFSAQPTFRELSAGMSDDYRIALEEGSTIVRIGTLLFGQRRG